MHGCMLLDGHAGGTKVQDRKGQDETSDAEAVVIHWKTENLIGNAGFNLEQH